MENTTSDSNKINRKNLTDQICEIFQSYIISKKWQDGQKLPSETDLAQQFNVSRMSMRAALQKLNAIGVVETKVGEGTFVKEFNVKNYFNQIAPYIVKEDMIENLWEYRKDMGINILRLCIERANNADIELLENVFDKFSKVTTLSDYLKRDYEFHLQICKMTKNSIYVIIYEQIRGLMEEYFKVSMNASMAKKDNVNKEKEAISDGIISHRRLKNAIVQKNIADAVEAHMYIIKFAMMR